MKKMTHDEAVAAFVSKTKLDVLTGCVNWTGTKTDEGYAIVWWQGRIQSAGRVAYHLRHRNVSPKLKVRHRCHNRACVNAAHLAVGSQSAATRNRTARTAGGQTAWLPLSHADRAAIVDLSEAHTAGLLPRATRRFIAQAFDVTPTSIGRILRKRKAKLAALQIAWMALLINQFA
jgi:hypothetical protein